MIQISFLLRPIRVGLLSFPLLLLVMGCAAATESAEVQSVEPSSEASSRPVGVPPENEGKVEGVPDSIGDVVTSEAALPATQRANGEDSTNMGLAGDANADVEYVRAVQGVDGSWTFHVTVRHPDTGWEDYADGWNVVAVSGQVLKRDPADPFTRLLLHPHEDEQPFTRSQSGIVIPDGIKQVTIRAHDLVAGFGGREVTIDLTTASGPGYEVDRP
jgi:hypothetical protein